MNPTPTTLARGDRKPDAVITISDTRADADFTSLTTGTCWVVAEQDGAIVFRAHPDSVAVNADSKTAQIRRAWGEGETNNVGRMYIWVEVEWPDGTVQHFPKGTPLVVDIRRKPGDA